MLINGINVFDVFFSIFSIFSIVFFRSIVDREMELIYLFGGKGNTSQVQVFDRNDFNVEIFYLVDDTTTNLQQRLNFVPILFENENDEDDKRILLMGGETEEYIPLTDIYASSSQNLANYYFNQLKKTIPLQAMGLYSTQTEQIQVSIEINLITNKVYITLDGPARKWFAIGFDAKSMSDRPYTIFVYKYAPNMEIEERRLESRGAGQKLSEQMLTIEEVEEYTTKIDNKDVEYRSVRISRDRVGITNDHFTFPSKETDMSIIYAHGATESEQINYHFQTNRNDGGLLFLEIACSQSGSVCTQQDVNYCCDSNHECDDVILFDINGVPQTEVRCCIPNTDLLSSCFIDAECCGDYVCANGAASGGIGLGGTCQEPQCLEDGHNCDKTSDCCERDIASCDTVYDESFNSYDVCCINTIDKDDCVNGGCCGFLQCDPVQETCRYPLGLGPCSDDEQCLTGLVCESGACLAAPTTTTTTTTQEPTQAPTKRFVFIFLF